MSDDQAAIRRISRRWFLGGALGTGLSAAIGVRIATPRPGPLVVSTNTAAAGLFRHLVDRWNEDDRHRNSPAVVEDVGESTAEQYKAMRLRAEQGWGDILHLDSIYLSEFAGAGWIAGLPDEVVRESILPGPRRTCFRDPTDKKLYAAPFNTDVGIIFSQRSLGADRVDLTKLVASVPVRSRGLKAQLGGRNEALVVNVLEHALAVKPELLSPEGVLKFDVALWEDALQPLTRAVGEGRIDQITDEKQTTAAFWRAAKGKQAEHLYMRNWPFRGDGNGRKAAHAAALTTGVLGGQNLAVVAGSPRQEQAVELVEFLTSAQSQTDLVLHKFAPVDEDAYRYSAAIESRPYLPKVLEGVQNARPRPITPHYRDFSIALQKRLADYLDDPAQNPINEDSLNALKNIHDGEEG